VTYLHIHEDDDLTLGVFCFPRGAVIPLHDHPGMTVLSRWARGF
jgi:quercetin dioxygenase-like cupin family protein